MTAQKKGGTATKKTREHVLTQEDLDNDPSLVEGGHKVGDKVKVAIDEPEQSTSSKQTFEEWEVKVLNKITEGKEPELKKVDMVKEVRLLPEVAERLNQSVWHSKIYYYPKA